MAESNFVVKNGLVVNTSFTANSTKVAFGAVNASANGVEITLTKINIGNSSVNSTINSTSFSGSSNNTSYVGSVAAANVVSNSQLSSNLSNYQTTAGLSANVATLAANNASYLGGTAAASYALKADVHYIGTTSIALNRSSASQSLTGINIDGSAATFTSTTQNSQFNSIGVGTAASGTGGEIRATNNITAYYSDDRLKVRKGNIENALAKVQSLNGFHYEANETAQALGYKVMPEVGVSAQEVQAVLPEIVVPAPIDEQYLTVRYEKLVPLLIEAIKELKAELDELKGK